MRHAPRLLITTLALALVACGDRDGGAPTEAGGSVAALADQRGRLEHRAIGDYRFRIPENFNGGIFGGAVGNRLEFEARREATGAVSGRYRYSQTFQGETFTFSGPVTCFRVYDTPTLKRFPGIQPMSDNRAKWGGRIDSTNDPSIPAGTFIWFQSIDNGPSQDEDVEDDEAAGRPASPYLYTPDLSTLSGFGDEAANEAFCDSDLVPNSDFGPHAVKGILRVR